MRKQMFRRWALRLLASCVLISALLAGIVLNPGMLYARATAAGNVTIYHNNIPDAAFAEKLHDAKQLIAASALYDPALRLAVCMNDGSYYPKLIKQVQGDAFAWGFEHKVVLNGMMNAADNCVELHGYKWNLTELLAHEATHCMEYNHCGLLHSRPIASIPVWKWEGYAEYVARKRHADLARNITALLETEQKDANGWITLGDGTGATIAYYKYWVLVQYCMDVKQRDFDGLLRDGASEAQVMEEMMGWYKGR